MKRVTAEMIIFRCAGMPRVLHVDEANGVAVFSGAQAEDMHLEQGVVSFENYALQKGKQIGGYVPYREQKYAIVDCDGKYAYSSVQNGNLYLEAEGRKLELSDELIYSLIHSVLQANGARKFVTNIVDEHLQYECSVLFYDLDAEHVARRTISLSSPIIIDDAVYGGEGTDIFRLAASDLSDVWKVSVSCKERIYMSGSVRSWTPTGFEDSILVYLGHIHDETFEKEGYAYRYYKKGILCALAKSDGSERWLRELEWSLEDMVLHEQQLYISTNDRLEVLDPRTGQTVMSVNTGLSMPEHRGANPCLASLHVDDDYIYYLPAFEPRILIYERRTLALHKELMLPNYWCPKELQMVALDGRLFIGLELNAYGASDIHRNAILELHPAYLDESVQVEAGPETTVELRQSEAEAGKEEIWIEIRCSSLDDALRFGELHTQNQAYIHGWHATMMRSPSNPKFNGKVHFRYSGCEQRADFVREKLQVMEQRFERWNSCEEEANAGEFIYAGDGSKRLCTLDAQYIE